MFMDPESVMKTAADAITSCLDCNGFIIDLRGNPGGIGAMAMGLAGWFVEEKGLRLGAMHTRETVLRFVVNPRPVTYRGPLAILVDGSSGSTAEIFAGGMKDLKRARILGSRTAGAALPSVIEKLPNGDGFQFAIANYISEGGQPLEGIGVIPDEEVELTRETLLEGRDTVLEAALNWIKQQK
jgi:carboxyl-terminal processing protease